MLNIVQKGVINKDGGLVMYMGEVNDFLKKNKDSHVLVEFKILEGPPSTALKGYYYAGIIPGFRKALWNSGDRKTVEQTEYFIREISPIMVKEYQNEHGNYVHDELKKIEDLSNSELIEHIEFLKQFAAENYSFYIEDPQTFK